jgi:ABC-type transport system substrate-binding protein
LELFGRDWRRRRIASARLARLVVPIHPGLGPGLVLLLALAALLAGLGGCSNDPYPASDEQQKVVYSSFHEAPRTLDPAKAYNTVAHAITGAVYDTLLTYHFLKRPLELIPGLAVELPEKIELEDGRVRYRFELRRDLLFAEDPSFELGAPGRRTREVVAADVAFQLARIADPAVGSPVIEPFSNIEGLAEFGTALVARREADPDFAALPVHEQYESLGGIAGVATPSRYVLEITLPRPYPQIRYWFAMEFSTPVPWEAVAYYDGDEGRPRFDDHPVGTGPFILSTYDKQSRYVLERSPNWYGVRHPEWQAPAATYPSEGAPGDREAGRLEDAGRPLPFIDRVEVRREKESIPSFNKFIQGYYDASGIIRESFDRIIQDGGLSEDMEEMGIQLEKSVAPDVFYIGFNMDDPVVGRTGGKRSRKLRQAMSLVVDVEEFTRVFPNGRGVPAQSPVPPGIYGHLEGYRNPYRQVDVERAKALMVEAGYPGGIDPETGRALRLTFDTSATTTDGKQQILFFTTAWAELGIDVEIAQTNYNQFQEKIRNNAHQIFQFGWVADYPDPENFLFLLWSEMANSKNGGPNATNFSDERFDELFLSMKVRENGPQRMAEIQEMLSILERERPWVELFHREDYSIYHGWVRNVKPMGLSMPTYQYRDVDAELRAQRREEWNRPIVWPVWALGIAMVGLLVPGIRTYWKERQ